MAALLLLATADADSTQSWALESAAVCTSGAAAVVYSLAGLTRANLTYTAQNILQQTYVTVTVQRVVARVGPTVAKPIVLWLCLHW